MASYPPVILQFFVQSTLWEVFLKGYEILDSTSISTFILYTFLMTRANCYAIDEINAFETVNI
jgi:hypothetical protein